MAFCELIYFYGINHDITIDTSYILHVKLFSYDIFVYVLKNLIGEIDRFSVFVKGFQYVILLVVWGGSKNILECQEEEFWSIRICGCDTGISMRRLRMSRCRVLSVRSVRSVELLL